MKQILIIAIGIMIIGGGIYGYQQYNKTHDDVAQTKADFRLTAVDLFEEFDNNEDAANTKYFGKTIEISGKVGNIETENSSTQLYLDTGDDISSIMCEMTTDQDTSLLMEGDEVVIRGILAGVLMDIVLNRCVIIKK